MVWGRPGARSSILGLPVAKLSFKKMEFNFRIDEGRLTQERQKLLTAKFAKNFRQGRKEERVERAASLCSSLFATL
jgi:hypothetical protein